jgi:hypothetical protein
MDDLALLWDGLLSRQATLIRTAWATLSPGEKRAVYAHLVRMATEPGWTEPQRDSAQIALAVLGAQRPDSHDSHP